MAMVSHAFLAFVLVAAQQAAALRPLHPDLNDSALWLGYEENIGDSWDLRSQQEDPDDSWEWTGRGGLWTRPNAGIEPECKKVMPPSLAYIGPGHCGSTSLSQYMAQHPDLSFGDYKEHRYLCNSNGGSCNARQGCSPQTIPGYYEEFAVNCSVKRTFDASPQYFTLPLDATKPPGKHQCMNWRPEVKDPVERAKTVEEVFSSAVQFIVMLRDPVDMLKSLFRVHDYDAIVGKNHSHACYARELKPWLTAFPRDRFLFLDASDLFANPQDVLDRVFEFVGVPAMKVEPLAPEYQGRRRSTLAVDDRTRRDFHSKSYNRQCKQDLEAMTGLTFQWESS